MREAKKRESIEGYRRVNSSGASSTIYRFNILLGEFATWHSAHSHIYSSHHPLGARLNYATIDIHHRISRAGIPTQAVVEFNAVCKSTDSLEFRLQPLKFFFQLHQATYE